MALVNAYCTVQDVRDQLSDKDGKVDDALLERAISATSRAIDSWCGRRFWQDPTPVARRYRPTDRCVVQVDDISTTTGLLVDTDPASDGSWSTSWTLDEDYRLGPENADADGGAYAWWEVETAGGQWWATGRRLPSLRITARWGWSAVPAPVVSACVLKATALFKRKESPSGVAGFGDFGAVRISRVDPDVVALLSPYQKAMVG